MRPADRARTRSAGSAMFGVRRRPAVRSGHRARPADAAIRSGLPGPAVGARPRSCPCAIRAGIKAGIERSDRRAPCDPVRASSSPANAAIRFCRPVRSGVGQVTACRAIRVGIERADRRCPAVRSGHQARPQTRRSTPAFPILPGGRQDAQTGAFGHEARPAGRSAPVGGKRPSRRSAVRSCPNLPAPTSIRPISTYNLGNFP